MRLLEILVLSLVSTTLIISTASALVTVDATTAAVSPMHVGDTFDVDISVTWDGADSLIGIFSSHTWDNTQLVLLGAVFPNNPQFETAPIIFKGGSYEPGLTRLGTIAAGIAGDDLSSTARTVQYGAPPPFISGVSAESELITRLTFQIIGGIGEGPVEIVGALLLGDNGAGRVGGVVIPDDFAFGSKISIVVIPEPGTALLMGLGLAGLAALRRHCNHCNHCHHCHHVDD